MKAKLLMLTALASFAMSAMATSFEVKYGHKPNTDRRDKTDQRWRNSQGEQAWSDFNQERYGHGYVTRTCDTNDFQDLDGTTPTGTVLGHTYLVSWVDSYGWDYSTKEGYAYLLSKEIEDGHVAKPHYTRNHTYKHIYWTHTDNYPVCYYSGESRHFDYGEHSVYVRDNQDYYTVAGAWDITNRPGRETLFNAIELAYTVRDWYNYKEEKFDFEFSSEKTSVFYQMTSQIRDAIRVMDSSSDDAQADDAKYVAAAKTLKAWIEALKNYENCENNKARLIADKEYFDEKVKALTLSDGTTTASYEVIPGVNDLVNYVKDYYDYNVDKTLLLAHSFVMLHSGLGVATELAEDVTLENSQYYAKVTDAQYDPKTPSKTVFGYQPMAYINNETIAEYLAKANNLRKEATDKYEEVIGAIRSSEYPVYDAENAANDYIASLRYVAELKMAEFNCMKVLDQVATFINTECSSDYALELLRDEVVRTQQVLLNSEAVDEILLQTEVLQDAFARAKEYIKLNVAQDNLRQTIFNANDIFNNEMTKTTEYTKVAYQSRANLGKAIVTAQNELADTWTIQTTKTTAGKWDLNTYTWNRNGVTYTEEAPSATIVRADSTLAHAVELYTRQYSYETIIDSLQKKYDTNAALYAYPKVILKNAIDYAVAENVLITNLTVGTANGRAYAKPCDAVDTDIKSLLIENESADKWQYKINVCVNHAILIDTYGASSESLNYKATHDSLGLAIAEYYDKFMITLNTAPGVNQGIVNLNDSVAKYQLEDVDLTYLKAVFARGDKFLAANQDKMNDYQLSIYHSAMACAQAVLGEVENTGRTWSDPKHARFFFACWGVDFAMLMSPYIKSFQDIENYTYETWDGLTRAQFHASLAVVASYINSNDFDRDGILMNQEDLDTYLEAIKIFNEVYPSDEEMEEAKAKVLALLPAVTAIQNVKANTSVETENLNDGKYFKNGQLIIVKNGKQYNAAGAQMK